MPEAGNKIPDIETIGQEITKAYILNKRDPELGNIIKEGWYVRKLTVCCKMKARRSEVSTESRLHSIVCFSVHRFLHNDHYLMRA